MESSVAVAVLCEDAASFAAALKRRCAQTALLCKRAFDVVVASPNAMELIPYDIRCKPTRNRVVLHAY